jgi:uncharacterized membrane protein
VIAGAAAVPLIALNLLASAIWVGGLVAIFVVARVTSATLEPSARIAFFRALGRLYGIVGCSALLVAMVTGAILLRDHPWEGLLIATAVVACNLLAATAIGIRQARRMTRLRRRALSGPTLLQEQVRRGAIAATTLRATIGALTLALVVLASALAQ